MSASYKLVRMPDPTKSGIIRPLHPRFVPNSTVTTDTLMEVIVSRSSFSSADVKGVLQLLQDTLASHLMMGFSVKLEGIGTFSVSLKGRPVMDKKEIRSESIHFKDVKFRSSKALRVRLKAMPVYRSEVKERESFTLEECEKRLLWYLENRKPFITGRIYQALNHCGKTKAAAELKHFRQKGIITRQGYGPTTFYTKAEE